MISEILAVISFIVVVAVTCKVWNLYVRKQLKKEKEELKRRKLANLTRGGRENE